jgi:hypothetical protein
MRAESCGIADAAAQELDTVPTPRSSIPIRVSPTVKEMPVPFRQRMMPQSSARTVRHLFLILHQTDRIISTVPSADILPNVALSFRFTPSICTIVPL